MLTEWYSEDPQFYKSLVLEQRGSLFSTVFKYIIKPYLLQLGYFLEAKVSKTAFKNMLYLGVWLYPVDSCRINE